MWYYSIHTANSANKCSLLEQGSDEILYNHKFEFLKIVASYENQFFLNKWELITVIVR